MSLREVYEQGATALLADERCGLCEWLASLDVEDAEYADRILWELKKPKVHKFSADAAAAMLKAGGCPVGHNVVSRHRRARHGRVA